MGDGAEGEGGGGDGRGEREGERTGGGEGVDRGADRDVPDDPCLGNSPSPWGSPRGEGSSVGVSERSSDSGMEARREGG